MKYFIDKGLLKCTTNNAPPGCKITGINLRFVRELKFKKKHFDQNWIMEFKNVILTNIPKHDILLAHAPNLVELSISFSSLRDIAKHDLYGLAQLKTLRLNNNLIEYLPGNLFEFTPNLVSVDFMRNQIKYIDPNILVPLKSLTYFNLIGNSHIDALYSKTGAKKGLNIHSSLDNFKQEITRCCNQPPPSNNEAYIQHLTALCESQKVQIFNMRKTIAKLSKSPEDMDPEDFLIVVNDKHYMLNKKALVDNSKMFEKFFEQNPDADCLEIENVSEEIFDEIAKFIETGLKPNKNLNAFEVYNASNRLEIEGLKAIIVDAMMNDVNEENAIDILLFCNDFGKLDDLKMKAFEEFKKNFPTKSLHKDIASLSETLKKLWDGKLKMDKLIEEMNII